MLPGPALREQLLAGIEQEAVVPFLGRFPAVAAGPNPMQLQAVALGFTQQESTTLFRQGGVEGSLQNDQPMTINAQLVWRLGSHPDTLCRGF